MAIDYYKMFIELGDQYTSLVEQKEKIEIELARLSQLVQGTFNMLTLNQQAKVAEIIRKIDTRSPGLKQGVLMAMKARSGEWLTPPDIRNYLESIGFDFGTSSDRGLASIGTTLKRMLPSEIEAMALTTGQLAYRIKGSVPSPGSAIYGR